ncbi:geranyl transferase [Lysobacteraceae bacterium NML91-0268]|nr:geranyl transferase [Xanthomonadaceae bacterium NML91-0268]
MNDAAVAKAQLEQWRARIDSALAHSLPAADADPQPLHQAMRHAVLNGGKRIRPLLVYASGHALGAEASVLDEAALAIELIHCYSLVHDDLPAMDDDALRRGQPTVHIAYGEANAILAGDALQSLAFVRLAQAPLPAETRINLLRELAQAAGAPGMCGGQALDMQATGEKISLAQLERLHAMKTGALLRASVRMGALAAAASAEQQRLLDQYAQALGLAFQIKDDLLDIEGDSATLGKTAGKDAAQDKATFPALIGIQASRQRLAALSATMHSALNTLATLNNADTRTLALLAHNVVERES